MIYVLVPGRVVDSVEGHTDRQLLDQDVSQDALRDVVARNLGRIRGVEVVVLGSLPEAVDGDDVRALGRRDQSYCTTASERPEGDSRSA